MFGSVLQRTEAENTAIPDLTGSFKTISRVFRLFQMDNPQYYWLDSSARTESISSISTLYVSIHQSYYTATARNAADNAINSVSAEWLDELNGLRDNDNTNDDDNYLIALRLHDLIIDKTDYLYENGSPSNAQSAHSIVGVFDGSGAVCEGYARAYQYILNLMELV